MMDLKYDWNLEYDGYGFEIWWIWYMMDLVVNLEYDGFGFWILKYDGLEISRI